MQAYILNNVFFVIFRVLDPVKALNIDIALFVILFMSTLADDGDP